MEGDRFNRLSNNGDRVDERTFLQRSKALAGAALETAKDLKAMVNEALGREERGYLDERDPVYKLVRDHCEQFRSGYDFETGFYTPPEGAEGWTEIHLPRIFYGQGAVTESQANWLIDTLHFNNPDDPRLRDLRPTKRQTR